MITFLEGILEEKQPGRAVINTGGVGYEVLVPLSSFDRLPPEGAKTRILIYHHITDVSQVLFGFATEEERRMFTLLLGVSGVGLKIARTLVRVADEGKKQKLMEERDELSARLTLSKCLIRGGH